MAVIEELTEEEVMAEAANQAAATSTCNDAAPPLSSIHTKSADPVVASPSDLSEATADLKQRAARVLADGDADQARAFMKSLGVDDDEAATLARAASEMSARKGAEADTIVPPGVERDGWWYEGEAPHLSEMGAAAAAAPHALERLQIVAKTSGNSAAKEGDWEAALEHFFSAMELSWQRAPGRDGEALGTLHSNASLACMQLGRPSEALDHALSAARMRPEWDKAHGRVGAAYEALGRLEDAREAYNRAGRCSAEPGEFRAALRRVKVLLSEAQGDKEAVGGAPATASDADDQPTGRHSTATDHHDVDARPRAAEGGSGARVAESEKAGEMPEDDIGEPLDAPQAFQPTNARVIC